MTHHTRTHAHTHAPAPAPAPANTHMHAHLSVSTAPRPGFQECSGSYAGPAARNDAPPPPQHSGTPRPPSCQFFVCSDMGYEVPCGGDDCLLPPSPLHNRHTHTHLPASITCQGDDLCLLARPPPPSVSFVYVRVRPMAKLWPSSRRCLRWR